MNRLTSTPALSPVTHIVLLFARLSEVPATPADDPAPPEHPGAPPNAHSAERSLTYIRRET
jgi:hypothetical protein